MEQGICQSGRDAEAVLSDNEDLEGYLSPAEDTLSNLSDDSKPKAFAQVQLPLWLSAQAFLLLLVIKFSISPFRDPKGRMRTFWQKSLSLPFAMETGAFVTLSRETSGM